MHTKCQTHPQREPSIDVLPLHKGFISKYEQFLNSFETDERCRRAARSNELLSLYSRPAEEPTDDECDNDKPGQAATTGGFHEDE
mmetsp:Transcript_7998/g.9149  ORF Transcript_7998/g.9149 Transcript_7998/m.9149 type:complete len:85 (+) Transcript_7998:52-306(+)